MLGNILLATVLVGWAVLLLLYHNRYGNERELGKRFNNVAWDIAVYGTDEAFRHELKHWRWKGRWKKKLFRLRGRRIEIAEYWAQRLA
jgi:hypothetical protein